MYFNCASANTGTLTPPSYTVRAEVTGAGGATFDWTGYSTDHPDHFTLRADDVAVGPLAAGTHTWS